MIRRESTATFTLLKSCVNYFGMRCCMRSEKNVLCLDLLPFPNANIYVYFEFNEK